MRAPQPKHVGVQLHTQCHNVAAARNEQRRSLAAVPIFEQGDRFRVLVRFQLIWPVCPYANVLGEHCCEPGASPRSTPSLSALKHAQYGLLQEKYVVQVLNDTF